VGRKKRKDNTIEKYPCFVAMFDVNDPHKSGQVPKQILDFEDIHKVLIKGCDINYLLAGNDIVANNLVSIKVEQDGPHLIITAKS
jgi:hypothetical protein